MKLSTFLKKTEADRAPLKQFLSRLDELVPEDLYLVVQEEDVRTWSNTTCLSCANCCKNMTPTFTKQDIKRIAAYLKITTTEFKKRWTYTDDSGDEVNSTTPCQFLNLDNSCSIYEVRPIDCAEFPHHHKQPFEDYNDTFSTNTEYCPATFELVTRLKKRVEKDYEW